MSAQPPPTSGTVDTSATVLADAMLPGTEPIDWSVLEHSHGPAVDTPGHLHALEHSPSEAAREAAMNHLRDSILHQGAVLSAGPPAIRAVTALLAEGRAHPDTVEGIVEFLEETAWSMDDWIQQGSQARMLPLVVDALVDGYPAVRTMVERSSPDDVHLYARLLGAIALLPPLADQREDAAALIRAAMDRSTEPRHEFVELLTELGADVRDLLTDPDPVVRARAAIAHQDDPDARRAILDLLTVPPVHRLPTALLVLAALRFSPGFEPIAPAACRFVRDNTFRVADGWGAVTRFAFPEPHGPERTLRDSQRALVQALVETDRVWSSGDDEARRVLEDCGLPADREACRALVT